MSELPPAGPPFPRIEMMTVATPVIHNHRPSCARRGNAMERAPTWRGATAIAMPTKVGASTAYTSPKRKIASSCGAASASMSAVDGVMRSMPMSAATTAVPNASNQDSATNSRPIFL